MMCLLVMYILENICDWYRLFKAVIFENTKIARATVAGKRLFGLSSGMFQP